MHGLRTLVVLAVTAAAAVPAAHAEAPTVTGTVVAANARWSGDMIVTESEVRGAGGEIVRVVQLGGVVDGIGMQISHQPAVLSAGDDVALEVAPGLTASGATALVVLGADRLSSVAAVGGTALYGVQRTQKSHIPLWRDSGCLDMTYDTASVPEDAARVLDASFATWTSATAQCGGLSIASTRQAVIAAARDGRNTVHIRTDRWCRPATRSEPELCYAREASAVTRLMFVEDATSSEDGKILEADIELNGVDYVLLLPGTPVPATTRIVVDLQSVTTHEAGHVLGLAHDCGTGREAWPSDHAGNLVPSCEGLAPDSKSATATMFYRLDPGDTRARTLEAADTTGACLISRELSCERYVEGGCSAGGRRSGGPGLWIALGVVILVCRRRRA